MAEKKENKIDLVVTNTRPDLAVQTHIPLPGSYIVRDGKHEPNLDDAAMAERAKKNEKEQ
jgi:hypothetical protein